MFDDLSFTERRMLVSKLRTGTAACRYEIAQLRTSPRAVCYPGQKPEDYVALVDDAQALVDDVQAIDTARGL